jgi:hypothetical protein
MVHCGALSGIVSVAFFVRQKTIFCGTRVRRGGSRTAPGKFGQNQVSCAVSAHNNTLKMLFIPKIMQRRRPPLHSCDTITYFLSNEAAGEIGDITEFQVFL